MPYAPDHARQTRERILDSASRLFARKGFDAVSIDTLMQEAGLTRGAFYHHFADKAEVYSEAMLHAALRSPLSRDKAADTHQALLRIVDDYLSREHIEAAESPCPLAFLVTDVGNRETRVRNTYTRIYARLLGFIGRRLPAGRSHKRRQAIMAASALMIGGVAVGRALNDTELADALLDSCRVMARRVLMET